MSWDKYLALFGISTFKFMFAPLGGIPMGLTFFETYLSCVAGAVTAATFFYFMSEFFIIRSMKKRKRKIEEALRTGTELPQKKNFTFMNKLIVKIKRTLGIYGVCLFAPLFFSIPGGTITSAKFYGKKRQTFPLILTGIFMNGLIITSIVYINQIF